MTTLPLIAFYAIKAMKGLNNRLNKNLLKKSNLKYIYYLIFSVFTPNKYNTIYLHRPYIETLLNCYLQNKTSLFEL